MFSETDTPFPNCDPHLGPVAMVMEFETFFLEKDGSINSTYLKAPPPLKCNFYQVWLRFDM